MLVAHQSIRAAHLAEAYLLAGRIDDASRCALRALDLSRSHQERGHQAWIIRLLGEIASGSDPPAIQPAAANYREALALAEELGMRPLVAHCHLGLAKLSQKECEGQKAEDHLLVAETMYREMGIGFGLRQPEAGMRELGPA